MHDKPRWTGTPIKETNVTGYLFPFKESPLTVRVLGCDDWFLPLFSTEAKLRDYVQRLFGEEPYKIKQVQSQGEFLESIFASRVRVMVDPYFIDGKIRWLEVVWEGDEYKIIGEK